MRLRTKKNEQLGTSLLLGRIESDPLCQTWRARDVISDPVSEPYVVRRFPAIPSEALRTAASRAATILPHFRGPAIGRSQRIGSSEGESFLIHEHEGGRSLAFIVQQARSGNAGRLPLPTDLALTIAEKIALALGATHALGQDGVRILHGGLHPLFVWITADGEVRLTGQELGRAMQAALENESTRALIRPFLAPEVVLGGSPTTAADIYSVGAILFLLLTGQAPPECRTATQNIERVRDARSWVSEDQLSEVLQRVLVRCLAPEPAMRYKSATELREVIATILHAGTSGSTTFNLAFYLHTLLRRDFEEERAARLAESAATGDASSPKSRKSVRVFAASLATAILASGIAAAYLKFVPARIESTGPEVRSSVSTPAPPPVSETLPVAQSIAAPVDVSAEAPPILDDAAAREAAFEAAVNAKLREEMIKLQARYDEELRRQRQKGSPGNLPARSSSTLPAATQAAPAGSSREPGREDAGMAPDELERRRAAASQAIPESSPAGSSSGQTAPTEAASIVTREGQLIELASVDQPPAVARSSDPIYPSQARIRKIEGSVILSVLVSETGSVLDVRVMRGDQRDQGLNESAIASVRQWQFTPAIKDGQRVRTWMPVAVSFKIPK